MGFDTESFSFGLLSMIGRVALFFLAFYLGHIVGCLLSGHELALDTMVFEALIAPLSSLFFLIFGPLLGIGLICIVFTDMPRVPLLYGILATNTLSSFINVPYVRHSHLGLGHIVFGPLLALALIGPAIRWWQLKRASESDPE